MNINYFVKKGFTFSEVLITLTVIGIVAALTIPFIHANYTKEIRNAKVKKFHKLMNDVLDSYTEDNYGAKISVFLPLWEGHNSEAVSSVIAAIKPYLPVEKDCGFSQEGCDSEVKYRYMNGQAVGESFYNTDVWYNMTFQDGSSVHFHNSILSTRSNGEDKHIVMDYDINGSAGPNRVGYDLFRFELWFQKNKMYPHLFYLDAPRTLVGDTCTKNNNGFDCAAKILQNIEY